MMPRWNPAGTPRLAVVFNVQGSEFIFLLVVALIILGPEKLPDAIRKFGRAYAEFKKMANGFQGEIRSALDEPLRELRETGDLMRSATNFDLGAIISGTATDQVAAPAAEAAPTDAAATDSGLNFGTTTPRRTRAEATIDASDGSAANDEVNDSGLNFGSASPRRSRTPSAQSSPAGVDDAVGSSLEPGDAVE